MGHIINTDREYRLLQQRLNRMLTGAPESPVFIKILKMLFSPREAELARKIPGMPATIESIAGKLDLSVDELGDTLTEMAKRGVVIDVEHKGKRYFALPPVVIGFFEFTFMRTRDNVTLSELAKLFDRYMNENDRFARSIFQGQTQPGRTLVREEVLSEENHTEILDWERSSHIIESASSISLSLCPCRHKAKHLEKACDSPMETCMALNYCADAVVRSGMGRSITKHEALHIIDDCKNHGLVQTGDNVQQKVTYICNCCGCCCGMFHAVKTFDIRNAVVTSNWIMEVDHHKCTGCGKCTFFCPVDAIEIISEPEDPGGRKRALLDETLCLGCGACCSACKAGGASMKHRLQKTYTPETIFDKIVAMAIERGKLAELIFENPEKLSHRALGRIISIVEQSSTFKAAMAIKPLHSIFLNTLVRGAKKYAGEIGTLWTSD